MNKQVLNLFKSDFHQPQKFKKTGRGVLWAATVTTRVIFQGWQVSREAYWKQLCAVLSLRGIYCCTCRCVLRLLLPARDSKPPGEMHFPRCSSQRTWHWLCETSWQRDRMIPMKLHVKTCFKKHFFCQLFLAMWPHFPNHVNWSGLLPFIPPRRCPKGQEKVKLDLDPERRP